jgi:hypothetical protein
METGNWYIYETKNLINGKTYIGQRKCPKNKTPETDIGYMGSGIYLKRAFLKYGNENFRKRIIIGNIPYKDEINRLEVYYIGLYKKHRMAEYNIAAGGQGNIGKDAYKKLSEKFKGNKFAIGNKSMSGKNILS